MQDYLQNLRIFVAVRKVTQDYSITVDCFRTLWSFYCIKGMILLHHIFSVSTAFGKESSMNNLPFPVHFNLSYLPIL